VTNIGSPELHRRCLLSTAPVIFTTAVEAQMLRIVSTVSKSSSTGILGKAANTCVSGRLHPNHVVNWNFQVDVLSHLPQHAMQI